MLIDFIAENFPSIFFWLAALALLINILPTILRKPSTPSCAKCRYDISACPTLQCPECASDLRDVGILTPVTHAEIAHTPKRFLLALLFFVPAVTLITLPFLSTSAFTHAAPLAAILVLTLAHIHLFFATIARPPHCANCDHTITEHTTTRCPGCHADLRVQGIISPKLRARRPIQPVAAAITILCLYTVIIALSYLLPHIIPLGCAPTRSEDVSIYAINQSQTANHNSIHAFGIFDQSLWPWTLQPMREIRCDYMSIRISINNNDLDLRRQDDGSWKIDLLIQNSARIPTENLPAIDMLHPDRATNILTLLALPTSGPDADAFADALAQIIDLTYTAPLLDQTTTLPNQHPLNNAWTVHNNTSILDRESTPANQHSTLFAIIWYAWTAAFFLLISATTSLYARRLNALSPPATLST